MAPKGTAADWDDRHIAMRLYITIKQLQNVIELHNYYDSPFESNYFEQGRCFCSQ